MSLNELIKEIKKAEDKKQAELLQRFFKTGPGQYGEGDIFLGIKVPIQRGIAKKYRLSLKDIQTLLSSKIHEHRLIGLFILIDKYKRAEQQQKKEIFNFYLKNTKNVNNWDLVDLSAPNIAGDYLINKNRKILYKLVKSDNLWERRIAILATFTFIKDKDFQDSIKLSEILLKDKHDLIHKAVGWMLREIGKKDEKVLTDFLDQHYKEMPRTMLRYSIERLNSKQKTYYMKK